MNQLAVVTLSRFDDIAMRFFTARGMPLKADRRIVVSDGLDREVIPLSWEIVEGLQPFNFARNANLGLEWVDGCDVLLVNDDVDIRRQDLAQELQRLAYTDLDVGILSPKVLGEIGSGEVRNAQWGGREVVYVQNYIPFVCVFMRREVLRRVGTLDEGFRGYGGEDIDYCMRVEAKGYRFAVAPRLVVEHAHCHSSFERVGDVGELVTVSDAYMKEKYSCGKR